MAEKVNLYIRLERPNNEYENGRLVFESSINKSVNFWLFVTNPEFAEFKGKVYLEVTADMSDAKKWLVNGLSLRAIAKDADTSKRFDDKVKEIAGCGLDDFTGLEPTVAWCRLVKLLSVDLPYGKIWTDHQYFPTTPKERKNFKITHDESEKSWSIKEDVCFADPIFEIKIDEAGRPIFSFRPDNSGYPATLECLLSDLETFLDRYSNYNSNGEWLLNTVFKE